MALGAHSRLFIVLCTRNIEAPAFSEIGGLYVIACYGAI